ncbi:MAG TPA: phage portal protein, partial [Burkholderiaceae bacterium]|nr:phage portal protein [Burkholderiaceae bacterium]
STGGRVRTAPAFNQPLYTLLAHCPNQWQTAYQLRWFLASQLIMTGNCFCQKIYDGKGDIIGLNPLNSWHMQARWDLSVPGQPQLLWHYSDAHGNVRTFKPTELWHTTSQNIEGSGIEGSRIIVLAKEAISVLMAAEETAGRQFANGLGMGGFITTPVGTEITEPEAQNVVDRLKRDFSGSQNAGKFTLLPGGLKWEKMTFNAQESQLLESRKWNAEEVVRVLGGAPLLVKLGISAQNSTYASSSAFLEDYWQTSLMPHCVALEQSLVRDCIAPKDRITLYPKHDSNVVLRGSLRERAETYEIQVRSGQITPNEVRVNEDQDTIDGWDVCFFPANSGVFVPATGEMFIPAQDKPKIAAPDKDEKPEPTGDTSAGAPLPPAARAAQTRLKTIASSLAERIMRKEAKGGIDAKFVAEVLSVSKEKAEAYIADRKQLSDEQARAALIALVEGN